MVGVICKIGYLDTVRQLKYWSEQINPLINHGFRIVKTIIAKNGIWTMEVLRRVTHVDG